MRRVAVVTVLTLSAGFALSARAQAQCLITPVGPLSVVLPVCQPPASPQIDAPALPPAGIPEEKVSTTPVAREVEGPHWALPSCDYPRRRGVRHAD